MKDRLGARVGATPIRPDSIPGSRLKGLVINYGEGGGLKTGRGACKVLPLRKGRGGGRKKVLAMLKGGTQSFGVVVMRYLEILAILKGGRAHKDSTL